jgi:UPF0042 nucleotide-binding protein
VTTELLLISGMSGAGRSTVAHVLEDLGWFVVDNLPPGLLPTLATLGARTEGRVDRLAVVVDVRGRAFFADLKDSLEQVRGAGLNPRIVFLEASDQALVRRFEAVRRPHPLQGSGRIVDGIKAERDVLSELRAQADLVIDTTDLTVHQLRDKVEALGRGAADTRVTLLSFGFKYGIPLDADLVLDMRFLPNPHWVPELRPLTGQTEDVRQYVLSQPSAEPALANIEGLLREALPGFRNEGKRFLTVAIGCTGGKHRSVAVAEDLARRLREDGVDLQVVHRDVGRE